MPPFDSFDRSPRRARRLPVRGCVRRDRRRRRARRAARRRPGGRVGRGVRQRQRRAVVPRRRRHARRQRRSARAVQPPRLPGGRRHHPGDRARGPRPRGVPGLRRAGPVRAGDRRGNDDHRRPDEDRRERGRHPRPGRRRPVAAARHCRADRLRDDARRPGGFATSGGSCTASGPTNVVENYYLYNPGEEDAEVTPVLLGFQPPAGMEPPDADRRARRRGRRVPHGRRRRPARRAAQRGVRHRAGDAGRRRARASPARSTAWRRPRSPSGRPRGPTATSPTRGTSGSARRPPPKAALALYNNTTADVRRHAAGDHAAGRADRARLRRHRRGPGAIRYLDLTDPLRSATS